MASLVANLGKDDFKKLEDIVLDGNAITDAGCATFVSAVDGAGLSALDHLWCLHNPSSEAARQAVEDALARAQARRLAVRRARCTRELSV